MNRKSGSEADGLGGYRYVNMRLRGGVYRHEGRGRIAPGGTLVVKAADVFPNAAGAVKYSRASVVVESGLAVPNSPTEIVGMLESSGEAEITNPGTDDAVFVLRVTVDNS